MDIRDLNRRTLATTIEIVDAVRADQLDLPTPCAEWTLWQLLGHMIGQHYGFAAQRAARPPTCPSGPTGRPALTCMRLMPPRWPT
jgi:hypothetical protein